jgi:hypothetical protein
MKLPSLPLIGRSITSALLALAVGGCANLGTQVEPGLPKTAKYPQDQAVALLLPAGAEGRLGEAVDAISAGYSAALARDPGNNAKPTNKDTSGGAVAAYEAATEASPRPLIIGPLLKADVNAIAEARSDESPAMLALNEANRTRPGLYQFALAPEDEAKTAASIINQLSDSRAGIFGTAIVYPRDDSWGERMRTAFTAALDDAPVAEVAYTAGQAGDLTGKLGAADIVFMVARPGDAAAVYAGLGGSSAAIPIIATSHAADNKADAADKSGLFYVDVPWLVYQDRARDYIARSTDKPKSAYTRGELGRLYAMGIDAYYLGALVANAGDAESLALALPAGMTGDLSFTTTGRMLSRQLALGRIGDAGVSGPASVEELAAAIAAGGATAQAGADASEG